MMVTEYQPITKERAAELLTVSKRTIDNLIADGTLPLPTAIGRRVYWHPTVFFAWLDQRLGVECDSGITAPTCARPRGRPRATPTFRAAPTRGADPDAKRPKSD